jgi:hypothetical protein
MINRLGGGQCSLCTGEIGGSLTYGCTLVQLCASSIANVSATRLPSRSMDPFECPDLNLVVTAPFQGIHR